MTSTFLITLLLHIWKSVRCGTYVLQYVAIELATYVHTTEPMNVVSFECPFIFATFVSTHIEFCQNTYMCICVPLELQTVERLTYVPQTC